AREVEAHDTGSLAAGSDVASFERVVAAVQAGALAGAVLVPHCPVEHVAVGPVAALVLVGDVDAAHRLADALAGHDLGDGDDEAVAVHVDRGADRDGAGGFGRGGLRRGGGGRLVGGLCVGGGRHVVGGCGGRRGGGAVACVAGGVADEEGGDDAEDPAPLLRLLRGRVLRRERRRGREAGGRELSGGRVVVHGSPW